MNEVLLELYRHKTWATLALIELCKANAEFLDAAAPGTFGTVRETLTHIVRSEEGYFFTLTGERPADMLPDGPAPLDELAARISRLGPRWETLALDADIPTQNYPDGARWRVPGKVIMAQAIHHADTHRQQVLSILGAHGLDVPDLSNWEFSDATGTTREIGSEPDG